MQTPSKRTLATILFTDIVGYSAISHRKESLALTLLEEHRVVLRGLFQKFGGKEIKTIGDAFLVQFSSAVGASHCATEILQALAERNRGETHERRIILRMALHLGDIVEHDDDVFGDGVNIAARLLHFAKDGGLVISRPVHDQVHSHLDGKAHSIGKKRLRNISKEIEIFRVEIPNVSRKPWPFWYRSWIRLRARRRFYIIPAGLALGLALASIQLRPGFDGSSPHENFQSLKKMIVLPLKNLTPSHQAATRETSSILAQGLMEEVTTTLSKNFKIRLLSKGAAEAPQMQGISSLEMGRRLGVDAVVDGSIQVEGNQLETALILTDVRSGEVVWTSRDHGTLDKMFRFQKQVPVRLIQGLKAHYKVESQGRELPARTSPQLSNEAFLLYLSGRFQVLRRTPESLHAGITLLEKAIKIQPDFAAALGALGNAYGLLGYYGAISPEEADKKCLPYIQRALEIDPHSSEARLALAEHQAYFSRNPKLAEESYVAAIQDDPSLFTGPHWFGEFLTSQGRFDEARAYFATSVEIEPLSPLAHTAATLPDYYSGNYAVAKRNLERILLMDPTFGVAHLWLGRNLTQLKEYAKADAEFKAALALSPNSPIILAHQGYALARAGKTAQAEKILSQILSARAHTYVSSYGVASLYMGLGKKAEALKWISKAYDEHSDYVVHLGVDPYFRDLVKTPEFLALSKKYETNRALASEK